MILDTGNLTTRITKHQNLISLLGIAVTTIHKTTSADISAQPSSSRNNFLTLDNAFRQRSPPTPMVKQNQILTHEYVDIDKTSERFSRTHQQDPNNTNPKTLFGPQAPMSMRDDMGYSKLYHTIKGGKCNIDGNFEENIDLSEDSSKRLRKTATSEKKLRYTR